MGLPTSIGWCPRRLQSADVTVLAQLHIMFLLAVAHHPIPGPDGCGHRNRFVDGGPRGYRPQPEHHPPPHLTHMSAVQRTLWPTLNDLDMRVRAPCRSVGSRSTTASARPHGTRGGLTFPASRRRPLIKARVATSVWIRHRR